MVDVFEVIPHDIPRHIGTLTTFAYGGQRPRVARYQNLVSKLSAWGGFTAYGIEVDWLANDGNLEVRSNRSASIKTLDDENTGPLVGTFPDAAAAMK